MAITMILPIALEPYAAHNDRVPVEATTAGEALRKLTERYPDLETKLPPDLENPPYGFGIYRNGMDLRRLRGLETDVRNGDRLTIIVPDGSM